MLDCDTPSGDIYHKFFLGINFNWYVGKLILYKFKILFHSFFGLFAVEKAGPQRYRSHLWIEVFIDRPRLPFWFSRCRKSCQLVRSGWISIKFWFFCAQWSFVENKPKRRLCNAACLDVVELVRRKNAKITWDKLFLDHGNGSYELTFFLFETVDSMG